MKLSTSHHECTNSLCSWWWMGYDQWSQGPATTCVFPIVMDLEECAKINSYSLSCFLSGYLITATETKPAQRGFRQSSGSPSPHFCCSLACLSRAQLVRILRLPEPHLPVLGSPDTDQTFWLTFQALWTLPSCPVPVWLSVNWPGPDVYSRALINFFAASEARGQAGRQGTVVMNRKHREPSWALPGMAYLAGWISAVESIESRGGAADGCQHTSVRY